MLHYYHHYFSSPIGTISLTANDSGLTYVAISKEIPHAQPSPLLKDAEKQLQEYFAGNRLTFSIPLAIEGTKFRKEVWKLLQQIPYGKTVSYQAIAVALRKPKASRAVGQAIHHNPLSIIIPCHRVIGKNGKLTGFAAGLDNKAWLLDHETQQTRSRSSVG